MASSDGSECCESDTTRVLLVGPQSLPVLVDEDGNAGDISVDLLQQALQGTSAIDDGDEGEPSEEVSLDALSGGNSDVVAIYQGEEGQTHTIKISLAEAQSLGLNFTNENFPVSLNDGSLVGGVKVASVGDELNGNSDGLNNASLLQGVACSNVAAEGRIIDEEGNIVEASESLQILPTSLSSLLEDGMSQSLSIIPQYEPDGTVTYAVKLKDQNGTVLGTDYHVLEPDSSAKTGFDIEDELKNSVLKPTVLHSAGAISSDSIGLTASVALSTASNSTSPTIQMPISTLEALSKQILLPVSSSSGPISVTLSIPTETSVPSNSPSAASSSNQSVGRYYRILTDRNSLGLSNVISHDSLVSQPALAIAQQQTQLLNSSTAMLNVQSTPTVTLLGNTRSISQAGPIKYPVTDKVPILPAPKNLSNPALKTVSAMKKLPISACAVAPAAVATTSILSPATASVAPFTTQPHFGAASGHKSMFSNVRTSSSNSNLSKPLGSSENPIQLVQQGQTFHSMQALSQAQLRQIATVLQQKHLNSNSHASKNVLFDEQTKTRIVYRVVYPEDVDLQQPSSPNEKSRSSTNQMGINSNLKRSGRPKKGRRKKQSMLEKNSPKMEQDVSTNSGLNSLANEVKGGVVEDSEVQEAMPKVEKKKTLTSRTRSGRVSRPPKHMMKDYKRMHHTDYKEKDNDDSDGGYSDYSNMEQPPEQPPIKEVDVFPVKRKNSRFTCPTCLKLYLGIGRMEKHFLQHPDHGSFEEFKQQLLSSIPVEPTHTEDAIPATEKEAKPPSKSNLSKGKKRSQSQSEKDRSDVRKKKLKQALQACEISEVLEVAGPLIARYYSLWDLLLLRLMSKDYPSVEKENLDDVVQHQKTDGGSENTQTRSSANRVQWLLMELSSLADTLQSWAGEIFCPPHINGAEKSHVEIRQKSVSDMLGISCGTYSVNEDHLVQRMESITSGSKRLEPEDPEAPPEKRSRNIDVAHGLNLSLNPEAGPDLCPEGLSPLTLMVKPVDDEKTMLAKLTEDMPFLNSSDDMICDNGDPDLTTGGKRDQDCDDPAAGLQVVDDIVNERLKNLSENLTFSVPLQTGLDTSDMSGEHLMSSFVGEETSISVSNSSVIPSSLTENSKPVVSVTNIDLMGSYSMSSLSRPIAHDMNISNTEPTTDLTNTLEPVSSQSMLSSFGMGLSSLTSFDSLQSQSSTVSHSDDSFLESLSSFETPLTQSCSSSNAPGPSFDDSVMKSNAMLQLTSESSEPPPRLPPKFISTFTPAITNEKSTNSISTAQRLQRSYLELDSGLDDGLDIDFEAFTQELSMNRNSSA